MAHNGKMRVERDPGDKQNPGKRMRPQPRWTHLDSSQVRTRKACAMFKLPLRSKLHIGRIDAQSHSILLALDRASEENGHVVYRLNVLPSNP